MVGVASYLLGAEHEIHINRHPLRGQLFENLVVLEALKYRFNRGKRSNLYFWRDGRGKEVDLLLEYGPETVAVEIKAGATISRDWLGGLKAFGRQLGTTPRMQSLVYGGTEAQRRTDLSIWPAWDVGGLMSEAEQMSAKKDRQ